jgi:ribonuclease J
MQDHKVVLMCTGSQGEPSSIVGRLSAGTNRQFALKPNDTVVLSSHPIPGNEETISKTINRLLRRGANVVSDSLAPIHVSGHASQEELKLLLNIVKPKHFIPIHGELRQLKQHAKLAIDVGIPEENVTVVENGQIVELSGKRVRLGQRIPGGYVFVDGQSIGEVNFGIMREREKLARSGIFLIDINVDKLNGKVLNEPDIITRGFVSHEEADELIPDVTKHIMDVVNDGGWESEKDIANTVKSYLYEYTKRRPMVFVTLSKG